MPVVPLKSYRLTWRKPWLAVEGGVVTFRLPGFFGGKTFSTPVSNVGVVDPRLLGEEPGTAEDVVFEVPVVVPYAYTTSAMTVPNVGLTFREPVRLPMPLLLRSRVDALAPKRGAVGGLPPGRYVDGLMLRAVDPDAAIAALAGAGAERVLEPEAWFVAHRAHETDPRRIARTQRVVRATVRIDRLVFRLLLPVGLALAAFGGISGQEAFVAGGFGASTAGVVLWSVWDWWADRGAFRRGRP